MEKLKIEYVGIDTIKPYEKNAKQHPAEQIEQIKRSIEKFGMDDPIGIWHDTIVEGHGRLIACKELGMEQVPIIRLDHLTDEERKAYTLAHNKLTMNSDFDIDILNEELASFDTIDMSDFGFDAEFDVDEEPQLIEDEPPALPEESNIKRGEIYQLGRHRVMCGDSTKKEDVEKLIDGKKMDLYLTDPPYNVDLGEINKTKLKISTERYKGANTTNIENDKMDDDDFVNFLTKAFELAMESLKPGGAFYIWHSSTENYSFQVAMHNVGMKLRQILIWNKSSLCLGLSDYQWKHEPCFYGWKEGAGHYFVNDRTLTTVYEDDIDISKLKLTEARELLRKLLEPKEPVTVIYEHKPLSNSEHPTMKPVRLMGRLIANSTKKNENVFDDFGGSGSTLIACEQLERTCYMMEYEPRFVEVIIERWETFTGQKAVKIK